MTADPVPAPAIDRPPVEPFLDEMKRLHARGNRVAGFIGTVLQRIDRHFPGTAAEEVERLRTEARDAAEGLAEVLRQWQETQPLRDANRAAAREELRVELDLSTPEGMTAHMAMQIGREGHGIAYLSGAKTLTHLWQVHHSDHVHNQRTLTHTHPEVAPEAGR